MPLKVTEDRLIEAMRRLKSTGLVAKELGIAARAVQARLLRIERIYGIKFERILASSGSAFMRNEIARKPQAPRPQMVDIPRLMPANEVVDDAIRKALRKRPHDISELCAMLRVHGGVIEDGLRRLIAAHLNVHRTGDVVSIEGDVPPMERSDELHTYQSDANGYYRMGIISDNHFGSRHCRLEVNDDLYDWFAAEKVDRVYNAGNWIEGEMRWNRYELTHVGMQQQVDFFCERYPRRPGIKTYYVAGDDHEGWYQQDTGINIGAFTETNAREKFGRDDLRYLGYVEAFISLRHKISGVETKMLVQHPGGGSSYATSYAPQKSVEALQSGEKPAVYVFGHWHKIFALLIRGVICIGAGCTKDLDTFGRKKKLAYNIGGTILELWQNPTTGAIERWRVEHRQWFDRNYHAGQFDHVGTGES